MGEVIVRIVASLVAVVVLMPIVLFFATPYVLLSPILRGVSERGYWAVVGKGYSRIARRTLDWGSAMLDL
jgi:hypothetical protein